MMSTTMIKGVTIAITNLVFESIEEKIGYYSWHEMKIHPSIS